MWGRPMMGNVSAQECPAGCREECPVVAGPFPPTMGPICWRDATRLCSGDCVAYNGILPADPSDMTDEQRRCSVLVSAHRSAKHLVILAKVASEYERRQQVVEADRRRVGSMGVLK